MHAPICRGPVVVVHRVEGEVVHGKLPVPPHRSARNEREALPHARIVDEVPRRDVVRAVEDDRRLLHNFERVRIREALLEGVDLNGRVEGEGAAFRGLDFGNADATVGMDHLPVEVGAVDDVGVHEDEMADAGRGEVQDGGAAEAAAADDDDAGIEERSGALGAALGEERLAAVPLDLGLGEVGLGGEE